MTVQIDKGIPMPTKEDTRPYKQMQVGDSFLSKLAHGNFYTDAKSAGIKVSVRKVEGGYRVWRIA